MLWWQDKTFCSFWKGCKNESTCEQKVTDEVVEVVKQGTIPVCLFVAPPEECYAQKTDN